jgi:RNA-directed DNA polymerase
MQAAVVLIIEPIFEADFEDCSYGFRPGRNAHQALERIAAALKAGKTEVYDADLDGYFDSIPHDKLMKCIRMRVVDGAVLGLIKQWLEAPVVEEIREEGKRERKPRYKVTRNSKGTPQGGVASTLSTRPADGTLALERPPRVELNLTMARHLVQEWS